mmetsp:Transcript_30119/g.76075  ORF Transcript_30119/g.76075 Transcript_30119/m.76075 type:complete len:254 (-) Transcript_30119:1189-1950(-)
MGADTTSRGRGRCPGAAAAAPGSRGALQTRAATGRSAAATTAALEAATPPQRCGHAATTAREGQAPARPPGCHQRGEGLLHDDPLPKSEISPSRDNLILGMDIAFIWRENFGCCEALKKYSAPMPHFGRPFDMNYEGTMVVDLLNICRDMRAINAQKAPTMCEEAHHVSVSKTVVAVRRGNHHFWVVVGAQNKLLPPPTITESGADSRILDVEVSAVERPEIDGVSQMHAGVGGGEIEHVFERVVAAARWELW